MASSIVDEAARIAFLAVLEGRLTEQGTERLNWERKIISPAGVTGLLLTAAGVPGEIRVVPVSRLRPSVKVLSPFPGDGEPRYWLMIHDTSGARNAPGWITNTADYDLESAITVILAWQDSCAEVQEIAAPPLSIEDLAPLQAIARERDLLRLGGSAIETESRQPESMMPSLSIGFEPDDPSTDLTASAREVLKDDLRHVNAGRLLANLPRDDKGRLALEQEVLLAWYETTVQQSRTRQMWLVARTPKRRKDDPIITIEVDYLIGENHAHRWDCARWLWDVRRSDANEAERWGVSNLAFDLLGLEGRTANLARMEEVCAGRSATFADRVALCMLLQDEGRILDALDLFFIETTPEVQKVLHGWPICLAEMALRERWAVALQRELRAAAPWRFASALQASVGTLACLPDGQVKSSAKPKQVRQRLFALPNQPQQSKASLMLVQGNAGPLLEIEYTASNARLAELLWRRPLEIDLIRFGLQQGGGA